MNKKPLLTVGIGSLVSVGLLAPVNFERVADVYKGIYKYIISDDRVLDEGPLFKSLSVEVRRNTSRAIYMAAYPKVPTRHTLRAECFKVADAYLRVAYGYTLNHYTHPDYKNADQFQEVPLPWEDFETVTQTQTILKRPLQPGDILYLSTEPGKDYSSVDMSKKPHWVVYLGTPGIWLDNLGKARSSKEVLAHLKIWRKIPPFADKHFVFAWYHVPKMKK